MPKKYELTTETKVVFGKTLYRIRALIAFGNIEAGELGGWIESDGNLTHNGNAWVSDNARVYGDARVYGNAQVSGDAWVSGNARVYGDARVYGNAQVSGDAEIIKSTHILVIGPVGSRSGYTTFYRTKNKRIEIVCGCFLGSIDKFLAAVTNTHGDNKHATVYRLAVELAKQQIEDVEED